MANCIRCGRVLPGFTFGKKICGWCKQYEAAQKGEVSKYQPVMANPWRRQEAMPMLITQVIFGINVAVFIGMLLSGASFMSPSAASLVAWGANYGPYTVSGQWWRLVTSCFVHIGIIHIAFNMWCLWSLGGLAERLYGHGTFAAVYLLCGISGSLGSLFWHHAAILSAGASGAIFGIAGAVIASIKLGEFSSSVMAQSVTRSLIAFVGYNVVFGLVSGMTDNACHIGGLLGGVVLGGLIAKLAPEPQPFSRRVVVFILVAGMLAGGVLALQRSASHFYRVRASERSERDAGLPVCRARLHSDFLTTL
jgi:membrane associated rhomboid family serine protease